MLNRLSRKLSFVLDGDARARGISQQRKLVRLSSDIRSRVDELPLAKGRSFSWLRRDIAVLLDRFETSLRILRRSIANLELSKEIQEEVSLELKPTRRPVDEAPQAKEETPKAAEVEVAPVEKEPESQPQPKAKEMEYRKPAWAERANLERRSDLAIVKPAGPPKDVEGAAKHLPCLSTELAIWMGEWNQAGAHIAYLETHVPEGVTSIQWRHALREATIKHRHAKERIGKCRRWVQGEAMLLAGRPEDWKRDFAEAEKALKALQRKIRQTIDAGKNPGEFKSQDEWSSNAERIKTTRIRPGMLAEELARMGISVEAESGREERS